jgi:hypothetical protein
MDVSGVTHRFHRILLSWDYFALCKRADEGKGVYDTLRAVPNTFSSIQVGTAAAAAAATGMAAAAAAAAALAAARRAGSLSYCL